MFKYTERYNLFFESSGLSFIRKRESLVNIKESYESIVRVCFYLGEPVSGKNSALKPYLKK